MAHLTASRRRAPKKRESSAMARKTPPCDPSPLTSRTIKHLAGKGLRAPSTLSTKQVQKLAASVEAHIEPRHTHKKR
jgi:hypothetical protein